MKPRIATLTIAMAFAASSLLWAQSDPAPGAMQMPMTEHEHGTSSGDMKAECQAMMAKHQAMDAQMKAMDAKLDALVATMNKAQGSKKVDATAAVVAELVAQCKTMRAEMASMDSMMMEHMMKHMQAGMMQGMMGAMAACPMMQKQPAGGEHEQHH